MARWSSPALALALCSAGAAAVTPAGKGLYSTVVLREYDCVGRRVRLLSAIDCSGRMGAGEPVDSSTRTGRWESIVAGAIDELYWNAACGAK